MEKETNIKMITFIKSNNFDVMIDTSNDIYCDFDNKMKRETVESYTMKTSDIGNITCKMNDYFCPVIIITSDTGTRVILSIDMDIFNTDIFDCYEYDEFSDTQKRALLELAHCFIYYIQGTSSDTYCNKNIGTTITEKLLASILYEIMRDDKKEKYNIILNRAGASSSLAIR